MPSPSKSGTQVLCGKMTAVDVSSHFVSLSILPENHQFFSEEAAFCFISLAFPFLISLASTLYLISFLLVALDLFLSDFF